jgi:PKD domain-containing protein
MRVTRVLLTMVILALAAASATAQSGIQYFVDPVNGADVAANGSQQAPWRTVAYAVGRIGLLPPASKAGLVLNLRANALYPPLVLPPSVQGTDAAPIVIQPYDGDRVVFDGGEPRFRQPGAWERVPGQADEWRTRDTFTTLPTERIAWGQLMDSKLRLITYATLEDMRAANESFVTVPNSDPRPGHPAKEPADKILFTYIGPGLFYVFENAEQTVGRVHLRLSSTHLNAPGIQDYQGGGDPNAMNLSIARATRLPLQVSTQNLVLRNLVFQNGGRSTVTVEANSRNITFDHCTVYGSRFGLVIAGDTSGLRFHHCTFDGGLAPWTTRTDVKDNVGSETHDILVIHAASRSEYVNCTFRHGHDALQLLGDQIEVRDSLFEDINDEVFQYVATVSNVRVHGNVVRQALMANSFHANPTGGPIYFYRNVVDQRVPTRGYRILPPDAPAPFIWRYGADYKDGLTPPFHVYQNTYLASHPAEKSSFVSQMFYADPTAPRSALNNLRLVLNLDRTLSRVPSASSPGTADGNVWYRFHPDPEPLFRSPLFASGSKPYFTFDQLWADFPDWERHSRYADPQLANFTDEYFDFQAAYPNTDFRPAAGSPAQGGGIELPADLPDDFSPGTSPPDVGARPVGGPVMAVGVAAATVFPDATVPIALAGPDQVVRDADEDGFERVTLDASASHDPDGSLSTYTWSIGGRNVLTSAAPQATLYLPEGDHYVRLVVTDNTGKSDSDAVRVRVVPLSPGENLLACAGFEDVPCDRWTGASGTLTATPTEVHSGARALRLNQNGSLQRVSQVVPISPGVYTVSGWLKTLSLTPSYAVLRASLLATDGTVLESRVVGQTRGNSPYAYHQTTLTAAADAAFIEIAGTVEGTGAGRAFFDDLRVRDRNLLRNGRFEERSASGGGRDVPGWQFGHLGEVVAEPDNSHSGRFALALAHGDYSLVTQTIVHVPGRGYRVSAWVKTVDLQTAPTLRVRFRDAVQGVGLRSIAAVTSEGAYTYVSGEVPASEIPAAAVLMNVEMRLDPVASGTAFFDDVMVVPIP